MTPEKLVNQLTVHTQGMQVEIRHGNQVIFSGSVKYIQLARLLVNAAQDEPDYKAQLKVASQGIDHLRRLVKQLGKYFPDNE